MICVIGIVLFQCIAGVSATLLSGGKHKHTASSLHANIKHMDCYNSVHITYVSAIVTEGQV